MNAYYGILAYLVVGAVGGIVGVKLKVPAGALIFAMLAVILFKMTSRVSWEIPKSFDFIAQVILGVMVGASFQPSMLPVLKKIFLPVAASTLTLVGVGLLLSIIFSRLGLLDPVTAYLGTSPGAMSVLVVMALDSQAATPLVVCFHFVRVVFVILTAPFCLKFFSG